MKRLDIFNPECTDCDLYKRAKSVCLEGKGNINGEVLFIADAPGGVDDEDGLAYSSESGKIFDLAIHDAGLTLDIGYMTYLVNCRPPNDREVTQEEIDACMQYVEKVAACMPNLKLVVPLGTIVKKALKIKGAITRIAGLPQPGVIGTDVYKCLPNVDPSYIFRHPEWVDKFINVFKMIPQILTGVDAGFIKISSGVEGWRALRSISGSREIKPKAFDLETTGLDPKKGSILMVSFYYAKMRKPTTFIIDTPKALKYLRDFFSSPSAKVCQNIAFEYGWGKYFFGVEMNNPHADTMIMSKREDTSRGADLGTIAASHVPEVAGFKIDSESAKMEGEEWWTIDSTILATRCALDSYTTLKAYLRMKVILGKAQMDTHINRDVKIACFIRRVRENGMNVNMQKLLSLEDTIDKEMEACVKQAKKLGVDCNLNSSQQVGVKLKEKGIITGKVSKDRKNQLTNIDILLELLEKFPHIKPILEPIIKYRGGVKNKGTYIKGVSTRAYRDSYFGGNFILRGGLRWPGTESFRLACKGAPLLTNPKGSFRSVYESRWEDGWILKADYSQLELRVLAAMSNDPRMRYIYENDLDIHDNTKVKIFGEGVKDPFGEIRSKAKAINFGVVYGGGPAMLQAQLRKFGILATLEECKNWILLFREEYTVAMEFMDGLQSEAIENLVSWSPAYHIKRTFHMGKDRRAKDIGKEGANHPIQCPAAQVALDGGYIFEEDLDPDDCLVIDIPHDEIVADCRTKQVLVEQATRLNDSMIAAANKQVWFDIPVKVDVEFGKSWGELRSIEEL